ncbi:MAG TPA: Alw26I/Eco31I/Esp3I family type II restriction adenine-specific DNA-methyltransferase [Blastocatellia bacterium]|nr:Alw26I/Eco31I/Esp3I family type II restriction adenine-specific DNA-methyltransferase [Blastocatellia bacterium]
MEAKQPLQSESKEHYSAIVDQPKYQAIRVGNKTLFSRAVGQFFTPPTIATHLVNALVNLLPLKPISVVDPFAGDGRLIVALLQGLSNIGWEKLLRISLWERDSQVLKLARRNVRLFASSCGIPIILRTRVCDTFRVASTFAEEFDLVVTNPPWEILKPDRRELKHLTGSDRDLYLSKLKSEDEFISHQYPLSQPSRKFSGWGTNLSRVGTEAAMLLVRKEGICAVVSPLSLFADQVSENLRRTIVSNYELTDLAYFPAEGRFFKKVDQPSVTFVAKKRPPQRLCPVISVYNSSGELADARRVRLTRKMVKSTGYCLPLQLGAGGFEILSAFSNLPRLAELESNPDSLWAGRELDETDRHAFLTTRGRHPFLKGQMIQRFTIAEQPKLFIRANGPRIPPSASHSRLVWRDVARPNQARRMHATMIPASWVTGNSLNVAFFRDDDTTKLKALLAIMNSIAFEVQVRALLATAHVSLGAVRRVHIPELTNRNIVLSLSTWVDKCLSGDLRAGVHFEVAVAKAYGLAKPRFRELLTFFPLLPEPHTRHLLDSHLWNAKH